MQHESSHTLKYSKLNIILKKKGKTILVFSYTSYHLYTYLQKICILT